MASDCVSVDYLNTLVEIWFAAQPSDFSILGYASTMNCGAVVSALVGGAANILSFTVLLALALFMLF